MKKHLPLLYLLSTILIFQACQKENIQADNSTAFDKTSLTNAASQKVYVKAIHPYSDSVVGGDSFPVTVVLNSPAPAGGFRAYVTTARPTEPITYVPAYVIIPEGQTTGTINVHTIPVRSQEIEVFFVGPTSSVNELEYLIAVIPRPAGDTRPPLQFLEAENAMLTGAHAVSDGDLYFSNGGFVEYDKANGGSVTFSFTIEKGGSYFLILKYATPSKFSLKNVVMQTALNNVKVPVTFPFTASENSTQIVNILQPLRKGVNKVTVTSIGKGTLRLDYLEVAAR